MFTAIFYAIYSVKSRNYRKLIVYINYQVASYTQYYTREFWATENMWVSSLCISLHATGYIIIFFSANR